MTGIDDARLFRDHSAMLGHEQIVSRIRDLVDGGTRQTVIAAVMEIPPPRVNEILSGVRQVKVDEAKRLCDAYNWDSPAVIQVVDAPPFSVGLARLVVRHIAREASTEIAEAKIEDLALDLVAFAGFVREPHRRERLELVEGMLAGRSSSRQVEIL